MTLLGQDKLLSGIREAAKADRLAHAYLICGASGTGKKTLAQELARLMMCPHGGCGSCPTCEKIKLGVHPDVIFVPMSGKVEQSRALRTDAYTLPNEGRRKIYILDGAEAMSPQAQDAFLKVLEEPPAYVVFLLLCADAGKILATVLSRTVRLDMAVPPETESAALVAQRAKAPVDAALAALRLSGGSIGQALSLLETGDPAALTADCARFCESLLTGSAYQAAALAHQKAADRQKFSAFLDLLALYFRDILVYKRTGNAALLAFGESAVQTADRMRLRAGRLTRIAEGLVRLREMCDRSVNMNLLEAKLVSLCLPERKIR